jgi:hypothetical protein
MKHLLNICNINGATDHPDMLSYKDLKEEVKEYDRVTVRRGLGTLGIIRGMSDEELARFLWEQNEGNRYWKSVEKYFDWLQQPAETEGK